jgi:hypothetical protein
MTVRSRAPPTESEQVSGKKSPPGSAAGKKVSRSMERVTDALEWELNVVVLSFQVKRYRQTISERGTQRHRIPVNI